MSSTIQVIDPDAFHRTFIRQPFAAGKSTTYFQIVRVEDVASRLIVPTLLHRTTYNYFVLLTQGQGLQLHNLDEVCIDSNTMLLVRVDTITAIQQISQDVTGFFIGFDTHIIEPLLTPRQMNQWYGMPACLHLTLSEREWLRGLIELMMIEQVSFADSMSESDQHLLAGLIIRLLPKSQDLAGGLSRDQLLTTRYKQLLHQQGNRHHSIGYYADQLAVSENYLFRCVKHITGKAPKNLLLDTLVLHAMVQLQNTTLDINTIAYGLGIDDPSYFGRLFRKQTGLTPTEYRQKIWQDLSGSSPH